MNLNFLESNVSLSKLNPNLSRANDRKSSLIKTDKEFGSGRNFSIMDPSMVASYPNFYARNLHNVVVIISPRNREMEGWGVKR